MDKNSVLSGLFGLCIGDALGVPVEFKSRDLIKKSPVTDMLGFGTHNQPVGTWSDDSSLSFCLADSLCNGYNLVDIADKFSKWFFQNYWTPHNKVFDIGITTRNAIYKIREGIPPLQCGEKSERSNGNGSLMRILPLVYHLYNKEEKEIFQKVSEVSSITHSHPRSIIACFIYIQIALQILKFKDKKPKTKLCEDGILNSINFIIKNNYFVDELQHFKRISNNIKKLNENEILSGGYVIHTLEASLWCFINYNCYEEIVLKAVNLGDDTDTTATVAGGIAGLYYGINDIPKKWIDNIAKKDEIIKLCNRIAEISLD
ncbi:MAG: hypothetical protein A2086_02790 [Spirochaetes bacterium GWD1_27_9]|nr:MAG: hypothetical protein A2Z98_14485 [Spirochaetes bacterium GWB1_27_13]OHD27263.1 MAG: hypothetical protein A2Y34_17210 [Spirochaetes bacterium GWC1_27_15]OHD31378.1 MAG: hypothetical protein A2086_02790 [Spirochaetes bacterium GWD1_27_9]